MTDIYFVKSDVHFTKTEKKIIEYIIASLRGEGGQRRLLPGRFPAGYPGGAGAGFVGDAPVRKPCGGGEKAPGPGADGGSSGRPVSAGGGDYPPDCRIF